jgi:hypothetical protein
LIRVKCTSPFTNPVRVRPRLRDARGSAILLSTAVVVVLVGALVLLSAYVSNTGLAFYYRDKLHLVTKQALLCYINELSYRGCVVPGSNAATAQAKVTTETADSLTQMGLPSGTVAFTTSGQQVSVTVSVNGLALLNNVVPIVLNMSDTVNGDLSSGHSAGILGLVQPGQPTVFVPTYGLFVSPWSNGTTDLRSAPACVATFYNANQKYDQFSYEYLGGAFSGTCP